MTLSTLNQRDHEFFAAISALIQNSFPEMAEKFGIWKVHQHFEIGEDEIFHETSNTSNRESTLRIIKKNELPEGAFPSTWKFENNKLVAATWCCDDSPIDRPRG